MVEFSKEYFDGKSCSSYSDYHKIGDSVYDITYRFLKKFVKYEKLDAKDLTILVIGCAYGYECKACKDFSFKKVVGIDVSEDVINEAKKTFSQIDFCVGDVCNLNFKENEFDIIMANNVLEHIEDPRKALKEIHRVGGRYALIRLDNVFMAEIFNGLPLFVRKFISKFKRIPPIIDTDLTHISQLPKYKWIQLFEYYGFEVRKIFSITRFPVVLTGHHHYILKVKK